MSLLTEIGGWNWEAIGAGAEVIGALGTIGAVFFAWKTIDAGSKDAALARQEAAKARQHAEANQRQQNIRAQGLVMSDCSKEYFIIRSSTVRDWSSAGTHTDKQKWVRDFYSERMYGLHFEEYHLFRQNMIPQHVYMTWIKSFRSEILQSTEQGLYPKLSIKEFIDLDPKEDFNEFISDILKVNTEVEARVEKEAKEPPYPAD